LLLDWEMDEFCNFVILITANKYKRIKRLTSDKNLSRADALARIALQKYSPVDERIDFTISNNSTKEEFKKKLEKIWQKIQTKQSI